jgi:uncharacterized protein YyaL (SSP411 family)
MRRFLLPLLLLLSSTARAAIEWSPWSEAAFARAAREHKLVLLDVEAVWCHWCHVMDQTTYRDPQVEKIIADHFVAVRVDQDARPDVSLRYEEWGWPATVILSPEGNDLAKERGYLEPGELLKVLNAIVKDPRPQESGKHAPPSSGPLSEKQRKQLRKQLDDFYDQKLAGWGRGHKLVNGPPIDYALAAAAFGDKVLGDRARATLDAALALLDPVWGGFYQYSTGGKWDAPHFEKIMAIQADAIRVYALGYALWGDPGHLTAARATAGFLDRFLSSPDGAFYTSMDADVSEAMTGHDLFPLDDAARQKRGIPRVDKQIYARENGLAIAALVALADASGDPAPLLRARRAAEWILAHRAAKEGGFRHGESGGSDFLGDTLAMGEAFLRLYSSTGERIWLTRAQSCTDRISAAFADPGAPGAFSTLPGSGPLARREKNVDENIALARFANLLAHFSGRPADRTLAESATRFLGGQIPVRPLMPGILHADRETGSAPLHITVVGKRDDPAAIALFTEARRAPLTYRRTEFWDRREGPLPHADVDYPELDTAAAFACSGSSCSLPVTTPEKLRATIARLRK